MDHIIWTIWYEQYDTGLVFYGSFDIDHLIWVIKSDPNRAPVNILRFIKSDYIANELIQM